MDADLLALWERVTICRVFPGYTLETARTAPAREMRRALAMIGIERRMRETERG